MSEQVDYDNDVLKFKKVWQDKKIQDKTQIDPVNLQTIESNRKNGKNKQESKTKNKKKQKPRESQKSKKKSIKIHQNFQNKKSVFEQKTAIRNKRPNYDQVIQVSTQPQKFYQSDTEDEKRQIYTSQIYFGGQSKSSYNNIYEMKKILEQKDYQLSMLRVTNSRTQDRVRYLQKQIEKKNEIIAQQRQRQRKIIQKNCSLESKEFNFDYGKTEYQNFKNDSRRLLKMLQATSQYKEFAKFGLEDDGVRFLHNVNKDLKSKIDNPPKNSQVIHFCTCNKAFIPEIGFWVPDKVYSFGKNFIKQRKGELTDAEFELLLYELNRIWRQRQKKIVNTYSALKAHEVGKYKRKIQNLSVSKQQRTNSFKQKNIENEE